MTLETKFGSGHRYRRAFATYLMLRVDSIVPLLHVFANVQHKHSNQISQTNIKGDN